MSMSHSYYLGPYLWLPERGSLDLSQWEDYVVEGRGELCAGKPDAILVPNKTLPEIDRNFWISDDYDWRATLKDVVHVSPAMIVKEKAALSRFAVDFIRFCDNNNVEVHEGWGLVPCFS